jgi:hypothetical protein
MGWITVLEENDKSKHNGATFTIAPYPEQYIKIHHRGYRAPIIEELEALLAYLQVKNDPAVRGADQVT